MAIDMFTTRTMLAMVEEGQKSNSTWSVSYTHRRAH